MVRILPVYRRLVMAIVGAFSFAIATLPANANPLHDAVIAGDGALVQILLDGGAPANQADVSGVTPLHYAAMVGKAEVVSVLIEAGADPNARDMRGVTPLHLAAAGGHHNAVKALLTGGADANPGFPADGRALHETQQQMQLVIDVDIDGADYDPQRR